MDDPDTPSFGETTIVRNTSCHPASGSVYGEKLLLISYQGYHIAQGGYHNITEVPSLMYFDTNMRSESI